MSTKIFPQPTIVGATWSQSPSVPARRSRYRGRRSLVSLKLLLEESRLRANRAAWILDLVRVHPDIGLHLDTILQAVTGNASRSIAASAMGSATSSGKVAAVGANGRQRRPSHDDDVFRRRTGPPTPLASSRGTERPCKRQSQSKPTGERDVELWPASPVRQVSRNEGRASPKIVELDRASDSTAECRDGETTRERPRKKRRRAGHDQVVASIFFASLAVSGTL